MSDALPVVYLNGRYLAIEDACVSPLDRGFLFGDAVYEVVPVFGGKPLLLDAHLQRLARSLAQLDITDPLQPSGWADVIEQLVERNGGGDLGVYLQVTRGADRGRDHLPPTGLEPTVFGMVSTAPAPSAAISAVTLPDTRWGRCDIKATALLANILARQQAAEAGADEAILVWDGMVTEGSSSSVLIVENHRLVRRPNGQDILPGTTTDLIVELAIDAGHACSEEMIPVTRLHEADEVWITSAMRGVAAVTVLDGHNIGDGRPGPVWRQVASLYEARKYGG